MHTRHNFMKSAAGFATICAAALAMPLFADPVQVDPADYECTFNVRFAGYKGASTLTDFPALIRLSAALNEFDYSKCAGGANLRFADADGNLIPHEIDTWDPSGTSLVWVKVPSLANGTVIKVYYGYIGSGTQPAVTASDVWSNGYVGVWHMNAASDSVTQNDSTANPINLTKARSDNVYQDGSQPGVDGRIGKAAEFRLRPDGKGGYFGKDQTGKLDGFPSITVEAWACQKAASTTEYNTLFVKRAGNGTGNNNRSFAMRLEAAKMIPCLYYYSRVDEETVDSLSMWPGSTTAELNKWCYHALRYDGAGGNKAYYSDATEIASWTSDTYKGTLNSLVNGDFFIGNWDDQWNALAFPGVIDEVRISNVARSKDWLIASHDTVDNDGFVSYEMENDWEKYSHKFTVSFTGFAGSTTLTDFPALVKISESGISGFRYADCLRPDGADLRFSDAEGNPLDHEIEIWNTNGVSLVWVKVPSLNASTKITAYYGWNFAPLVDPKAVWSNGYVGVWHMGADSGVYTQQDSTTNGLNLTCPDWVYEGFTGRSGVANGVDGIVGKSVAFDQNEKHYGAYAISDSRHMLDGFSAFTMEAWTFQNDHDPANATERSILYRIQGGSQAYYAYRLYEASDTGKHAFWFNLDGASSWSWITAGNAAVPTRAEWHYSARSWDGETGNVRGFQDDLCFVNSTDAQYKGQVATIGGQFVVGNTFETRWGTSAYPGIIDEVRISNVARSADWAKATYDTIKNNSTFTTYGSAREQVKGLMIIVR